MNRLIADESTHCLRGLAPRCRLILPSGGRILEGFGCSPIKRVRELGSHSQKKDNKSMNKTQINLNLNPTGRVNTLSSSSLPLILQSVFIGIMLGDGSLYRSSPTSNVRFEMSFGKKYEAFALHLGELFKDYMLNPVKSLEVKGLNKNYTNYRLKTRSLPIFVPYFNMFYIFTLAPIGLRQGQRLRGFDQGIRI